MTNPEILMLVSYMIGAFILGFGIGFLTVSFKKMFDQF